MRHVNAGPGGIGRYLLIAAVCAVTASACGSVSAARNGTAGNGTAGNGAAGSAGGGTSSTARVWLHITVTSQRAAVPAKTRTRTWTLRCDPPGGTHPHPAAACRILLAIKDPFAPEPRNMMCPMITDGTVQATVTGTYFGAKVHITLTDAGCYLQRWARIGPIFG